MEIPEVHILNRFDWQFFGTVTFKTERLPEHVRLNMAFALLREFCKASGLKFRFLLWCLRQERGEILGRRHFHFLLAGVRKAHVNPSTCTWLMNKWEELGGGMARIYVYDPGLNAGAYILKRSGFGNDIASDAYESAKFPSKACELMLADRIWKVAGWRSGYERARLARLR